MPSKPNVLQVFPWVGGVVSSRDEAEISPNQMVTCENYQFNPGGDRVKRDGIDFDWDDGALGSALLGGTDFTFQSGSSKITLKVSIDSNGNLYSYTSGGVRSLLVDAGTAWSDVPTRASFLTFNNKLLIAVDGDNNVVKMWDGSGDVEDLPNAPLASVLQEHLGRVWCDDKNLLDRVHYSQTGDETVWQGAGDSAALDLTPGDGDPTGISAIFPTFQGQLFVAKQTKIFRVEGFSPDTFNPICVSTAIGCLSQGAFATVGQQDIIFASERGFHQLTTTLNFGNFTSTYLSADIQDKFEQSFVYERRQYIKAIYIPQLSTVGFAVTDIDYGNDIYNNALWLYNLNDTQKAWHVWPLASECVFMSRDADKVRPYFGTTSGRLGRGFNGTYFDIDEAGNNISIPVRIVTGRIFVDGRSDIIKAFKYFGLIYRPTEEHQIDVLITIDNFQSQSITFDETSSLDLLGETFVLDSSILGSGVKLAPFTLPFDGYGRGIQISISSTDVDVRHILMGFVIGYEGAETSQETDLGGDE